MGIVSKYIFSILPNAQRSFYLKPDHLPIRPPSKHT